MATMDDVARLAGVSHGTVSKVLNGSINVSIDKIIRVQAAMETLNYKPNTFARVLKTQQTSELPIILPTIEDESMVLLYERINSIAINAGYQPSLLLSNEIPSRERQILTNIQSLKPAGVIIITCQPYNEDFFSSLKDSGLKLIFLHRSVPNPSFSCLEIDPSTILYDCITKDLVDGYNKIAIISGPQEYSFENKCISSFYSAISDSKKAVDPCYVISTNFNIKSAMRSTIQLLNLIDPPQIIYATSDLIRKGIMLALKYSNKSNRPIVRYLKSDNWSTEHTSASGIVLPYSKIADHALELLFSKAMLKNKSIPSQSRINTIIPLHKNNTLRILIHPAHGFEGDTSYKPFSSKIPKKISPSSSSLYSLIDDFQSNTGISVKIEVAQSNKELLNRLRCNATDESFDMYTIDLPWLNEFIDNKYLLPIDSINGTESIKEQFPKQVINKMGYRDNHLFAIPFSFTSQLLFYRTDLFNNIRNQRLFFDLYGSELTPPSSWDAYLQISRFFTQIINHNSPVKYGNVEFGGDCLSIWPRIWSYGGDIDPKTKKWTNKESVIRALTNYSESIKCSLNETYASNWMQGISSFMSGESAMICMFSDYMSSIDDRTISKVAGKVAVSPLPGTTSVCGGWSIGVNPKSEHITEAISLIKWMISQDIVVSSSILGRHIPLSETFTSSNYVSLLPWGSVSLDTFSKSKERPHFIDKNKHYIGQEINPVIDSIISAFIMGQYSANETADKIEDFLSKFLLG